jgi:hypothetical protein
VKQRLHLVVVALIVAITVASAGWGSTSHSVRSADGIAGWSWDGWSWDSVPPADTTAAPPADNVRG